MTLIFVIENEKISDSIRRVFTATNGCNLDHVEVEKVGKISVTNLTYLTWIN